MEDLIIERDFAVSPERLFQAVTQQADLLQWWGPEGMHVPLHDLDFTRLGPWYSVMQNPEGGQYKVSGQVTHIDPPNSVGFTWAWHDDADARGNESHVTFQISAQGDGARLTLRHVNLADEEAVANHNTGWSSSFNKIAPMLG